MLQFSLLLEGAYFAKVGLNIPKRGLAGENKKLVNYRL